MNLPDFKELAIDGIKMVELFINGVKVWAMKTFTNQVPISTDTDGSIFNGVGYIENRRLSSSGGLSGSAQNGSVTTGFIPYVYDQEVYMKGVEWFKASTNHGGHYYINFYDSKKSLVQAISSASMEDGYEGGLYCNYDEGTNVTKFYWSGSSAVYEQLVKTSAKFIRINAYGKGADMIVTINEEIT